MRSLRCSYMYIHRSLCAGYTKLQYWPNSRKPPEKQLRYGDPNNLVWFSNFFFFLFSAKVPDKYIVQKLLRYLRLMRNVGEGDSRRKIDR